LKKKLIEGSAAFINARLMKAALFPIRNPKSAFRNRVADRQCRVVRLYFGSRSNSLRGETHQWHASA
jgi:hypothetical protein